MLWLPRWHSGKESSCQCRRTRVRSLGWEDPLGEETSLTRRRIFMKKCLVWATELRITITRRMVVLHVPLLCDNNNTRIYSYVSKNTFFLEV